MKLNKVTSLIVVLLLLASATHAKRKEVKPFLHNKTVKVKSGKKKATSYYTLSKKFGTNIKVSGPGRVTLFVRSKIKEGQKASDPFTIKYTLDRKIIKVRKVRAAVLSNKSNVVD